MQDALEKKVSIGGKISEFAYEKAREKQGSVAKAVEYYTILEQKHEAVISHFGGISEALAALSVMSPSK